MRGDQCPIMFRTQTCSTACFMVNSVVFPINPEPTKQIPVNCSCDTNASRSTSEMDPSLRDAAVTLLSSN